MTSMTGAKIEKLCDRIADLIHKSEDLNGIAFLESLVEIDKCCNEVLEDEERALQSETFKSLVLYKCRLFNRKEKEFKNSSQIPKEDYLEIYRKFCDYAITDNRILLRIEDEIEYERKCHLGCGFSDESFHPFYRIKDYKHGKYSLYINGINYSDLSIDQLYKELEGEKEELEELEEEFEELEYLDEEEYEEYDFESEEEYKEKLKDLEDDVYFRKCDIELIEKILKERTKKE